MKILFPKSINSITDLEGKVIQMKTTSKIILEETKYLKSTTKCILLKRNKVNSTLDNTIIFKQIFLIFSIKIL